MLTKVKYIFALLIIYLVFLVILFPANVALQYAKDMNVIPKEVVLKNASGSLWTGRLNQAIIQGIHLEHVKWRIAPTSLLMGRLDIELKVGNRRSDINANGQLSVTNDGLTVTDFTFTSPIEPLIKEQPLPFGLNAMGNVQVKVDYFTQSKPWCSSLKATVTATDNRLTSPFGKLDVEQFSADLTCPKGEIKVVSKKANNSLGIDANVLLTKNKKYILEATALPPSDASKDYINLLKFSGKANNQGLYTFKYNGRL